MKGKAIMIVEKQFLIIAIQHYLDSILWNDSRQKVHNVRVTRTGRVHIDMEDKVSVAQRKEQLSSKKQVVGSNPTGNTK